MITVALFFVQKCGEGTCIPLIVLLVCAKKQKYIQTVFTAQTIFVH